MRKIETLQRKERKEKTIQIILGIGLIILMVTSTIGFVTVFHGGVDNGNSVEVEETISYNGIDLSKINGLWNFNFQGSNFATQNSPLDTESIKLEVEVSLSDIRGQNLYYIVDGPSSSNIQELIQNIGQTSSKVQEACLDQNNCRFDTLPIKDCSDNIIILNTMDEINVYKQNKCIFIESPLENQRLILDKILYRMMGIQ